jgi:hypothetical protein
MGKSPRVNNKRIKVPLDVRKSIVNLVVLYGHGEALRLLQCGADVLNDVRAPGAVLRPETLERLRARIVALTEEKGS